MYLHKQKGKMKYEWAMDHPEHVKTYLKRDGKCQNPHCGHNPIHVRHVLRNKYSGESVEIGTQCFWRWQAAHGIIVPELSAYEKTLMQKQIEEWVKEGPISGDEFNRRRVKAAHERRRKLYIREVHQKNPVRIDIKLSQFSEEKEAEEYAEKHGGYCNGEITMLGVKYWLLYIPKENAKKVSVCRRCNSVYPFGHRFCKCGTLLKTKYIIRDNPPK